MSYKLRLFVIEVGRGELMHRLKSKEVIWWEVFEMSWISQLRRFGISIADVGDDSIFRSSETQSLEGENLPCRDRSSHDLSVRRTLYHSESICTIDAL